MQAGEQGRADERDDLAVDLAVADEAAAVAATKQLLAYFQGPTPPGKEPDQARLRDLVPERERRAYPVGPEAEATGLVQKPRNWAAAGSLGPGGSAERELTDIKAADGNRTRVISLEG